jgi:hypothetical protein
MDPKDDSPRILATEDGGKTVFYHNRYLYSKKYPVQRIEQIIEHAQIPAGSYILLLSPLFFYGLSTIQKRFGANCKIIALEADRALWEITEKTQKDVLLYGPDDLDALADLDTSQYQRIHSIELSQGAKLHQELYGKILATLKNKAAETVKNTLTMNYFAQRWIRNLFRNLAYIQSCPISYLIPRFKEGNVFVCGAGESLESSLSWIKKHRKDIYLLAVDTALNTLQQSGIQADGVVALEGQILNIKDFHGIDTSTMDIYADLLSHPKILRMSWKHRYCFVSQFSNLKYLHRIQSQLGIPLIPPLGSVGIAALYIANVLSPDSSVHLTGLDFAYRRGKTHARGAPIHSFSYLRWKRTEPGHYYGFSLERSSKQLTEELYTEPKLEEYGNLVPQLDFSSSLIDHRKQGFPLGLNREIPERLQPLIELPAQPAQKPEIDAFVQKRLNLLEEVYSKGESFLTEISNRDLKAKAIQEIIQSEDYILAGFPDKNSFLTAELNDIQIKRLLVPTGIYLVLLRSLISEKSHFEEN